MTSTIARRLQALEAATPPAGITCIIFRAVRPGHMRDEVQSADVFGAKLTRCDGEAEADFIERARLLALAENPAPGRIPQFSIE